MVRGVLIIILALIGIFVHPFPPGILDFIFRLLLFSGIIYFIYSNQKFSFKIPQVLSNNTEKIRTDNINDLKENFI